MISLLKSIWQVSPPGHQLTYIVAINFVFLGTLFVCFLCDLIASDVMQAGNIVFWMVMGLICLLGQPRPWKSK